MADSEKPDGFEILSLLVIPLVGKNGRLLGTLSVHDRHWRPYVTVFSAEDEGIDHRLAEQPPILTRLREVPPGGVTTLLPIDKSNLNLRADGLINLRWFSGENMGEE